MLRQASAAAFVAWLGPLAAAQTLMVVESTDDTVLLIDEFDGSLLQRDFIDLGAAGASTPTEALVVNGEIWVSDQLLDGVLRFSLDGSTHLGNITGGLDNVRGIALVGNTLYVSNSGSVGGAPGAALVTIDVGSATVSGSFPVGDPFDVLDYNGNLLVANIAGKDIDIYDYAGNFIAKFHDSDGVTGIDFPEQLSLGTGGRVLAAGFSPPIGIYEYDSGGNQLHFHDTVAAGVSGGLRGVWPLGNGNILYTTGDGVHVFDPVLQSSTPIVTGVGGRFISRLDGSGAPPGTFCFGDGSGALCPCGNFGTAGRGCENGTGSGGGQLLFSGSTSIGAADLALHSSGVEPSQPGLFFQGLNAVGAGAGTAFGDGLRCAGGAVTRLQIRVADGLGNASTTVDIAAVGGVSPGDLRRYQHWYRNPVFSLCGSGFNLTNGVELTWQP